MVFLDRNVTFNTPSFCCSLSTRANLLLAYDFFRFLKRPQKAPRLLRGYEVRYHYKKLFYAFDF